MEVDEVVRVPVKSLVVTAEDEEESQAYAEAEEEYQRVRKNGYSSDSDSESTSSEEPSSASSTHLQSQERVRAQPPQPPPVLFPYLEGALPHFFLPKKLPESVQPNLIEIEGWILSQVSDTLEDIQQFPKLLSLSKMFLSWKSTQPKTLSDKHRFTKLFSYDLTNLQDGETIPLYVRKQNATVLISKEPAGNDSSRILIETFRPTLPSETIMSTVSPLQVTFPHTSNFIYNTKLLCSEMFAQQLHELTVEGFASAMSISIKANQEFLEHREVPDPFLVTDLLVAMLCPTSQYQSASTLTLSKKIRDEVTCLRSAKALPFRRSGLWTSVKVAIHLKLLHIVGNENDAKILYKCLLLRILSHVAQQYSLASGNGNQVNLDLLGQLTSKLGRRVRKLQRMSCEKKSAFAQEILHLYSTTLKQVHSVVHSISDKMKSSWFSECFPPSGEVLSISKSQEEFRSDLLHNIPWLLKHIEKYENPLASSLKHIIKGGKSKPDKHPKDKKKPPLPSVLHNGRSGVQEKFERYPSYSTLIQKGELENRTQLQIWRWDAEHFIKTQLDSDPTLQTDSKAVLDLLLAYVTATTQPYLLKDNPVGFSQTLLVSLKLVQVLDKITTKRWPLLLQYKSGVNATLFDKLLLPHKEDMLMLARLLAYFKERDKHAQFCRGGVLDGLLEDISPTNFACRFAPTCEEIVAIRRRILEEVESQVSSKHAEVEKVREECLQLQERMEERRKSCKKCFEDNPTEKCKECSALEEELESKRFSVSVYERPLPTEEHLQYVLAYELRIPPEIRDLREGLALLKYDLCREQQKKVDGTPLQIKWRQYKGQAKYRNDKQSKPKSGKSQAQGQDEDQDHVSLCSRLLSTSSTHHTQIQNPDVLHLPSKPGSDPWIVPNGMNCVYHYLRRNHLGQESATLAKLCTFQLSSTWVSGSGHGDKELDPYHTLQWALEGTTSSQNRAIAQFSSTYHPELVAFGSLRGGHRIQLLNLYRYLENGQLHLEKEPVLALILQTVWEVGSDHLGERKAHLEWTTNDDFVEEFLHLLESLLEGNETNYANPLILLSLVVMAVRVLEVNPSERWKDRCYQFLKRCRQCAANWLELVREEIAKKVEMDDKRLIKLQIEILLCSALSYHVSSEELFPFVIRDAEDLLHWFRTLSQLHELTQEVKRSSQSQSSKIVSPFLQVLLELARLIPFNLNLEGRLASTPDFCDLFLKCLHLFSCEKWDWGAGAARWELPSAENSSSPSNIIVGRYQSDVITFDLLQGTFLVNGFTRSGIPLNILDDPLFEMWFRGQASKLAVVQSHSTPESVLFRTTERWHGKHFEFELFPRNAVTIKEVVEDSGSRLELLNPDKFLGILSDELVYLYGHWLDPTKQVVYFRRLPQQDSDYSLPPEYTLRLDKPSSKWLLRDKLNNNFLFSRHSFGFKSIARALSRLELAPFINVTLTPAEENSDDKSDKITAKLPRLQLSFTLEGDHLSSREYVGFRVAPNQNERKTLIGLRQGLLLDNLQPDFKASTVPLPLKRLILVPHGHLEIHAGSPHQKVKVDLTHLRSPPFFCYEFDPVLKRLKADRSKSAWLYLAALHGATSSSAPSLMDPFTQLTGTEMSVQILQSGFVWSCSSYDEESLKTLKLIKRFSPLRQYYGHGLRSPNKGVRSPSPSLEEQMETTEWPHGLSATAAYDGFALLVDKLVEDSQSLSVLYPKLSNSFSESGAYARAESSPKLQLRAYHRHLGSYNRAAMLKNQFLPDQNFSKDVNLPEILLHKKAPLEGDGGFNLDMLLRLSQARYVSTLEDPLMGSHRKSDLFSYLLPPDAALESRKDEILLPASPIADGGIVPLRHLLECDLKESWLKFYHMAVSWPGSEEGRQAFSLVLCALAYQGAPAGQLLNLHNVSILAQTINCPVLPDHLKTCTFADYSTEHDFSPELLKQFLLVRAHARNSGPERVDRIYQKGQVRLVKQPSATPESDKLTKYEGRLEVEDKIDKIVQDVKGLWPCEKLPRNVIDDLYAENIWTGYDVKQMNGLITKWHRNWQLKQFILSVESYLDKFYEHFPNIPKHQKQFQLLSELKLEISLSSSSPEFDSNPFDHIASLTVEGDLDEPAIIFYSGSGFKETNVEGMIPTQREQCLQKIENYSSRLQSSIQGGTSKQVVLQAGLAPGLCPLLLLQYLLHGLRASCPGIVTPSMLKMIGALAILWTELKRFNRILALVAAKETKANELQTELDNGGHENWSPTEWPEWLVLELELDLMIRPIQVEVARQMMVMPGGRNGVIQLNMGEGKTSVIVPMLCLSMGQEKETICRVTVLHSIFKTNLNLLSYAVGGIVLARRVYTFPIRRDMDISLETLDRILQAYQTCLKLKGAVLTLPEYRLGFRLLSFDKALKGYPEVGVKFGEIENGLRRYCRDVLDESDELLQVKYQLVYTIGAQIPVDGGSLRWTVCQKVLQMVQDIAWVFLSKMGSASTEFDGTLQHQKPEQFVPFRLFDTGEGTVEELRSLVAEEFLKELKLTERQKQLVKRVLTQDRVSEENFKFVLSLFKNDQSQLDEFRLLVGYLRRDILALALSKRWRVEYGVDQGRNGLQYRRMAVPFRAKDCPSEKTEFGHPDLAIVLTHLSYYYGGLGDGELGEVMEVLKLKPERETIYSSWVAKLGSRLPRFLQSFSGLSLEDYYQRSLLFDLIRKNKAVIDFWLGCKVLPQECKQFPGKISMSAWDLCYEKQRLPITGFSGTNDSSILLPLPITQQDLPQLNGTNKKMEEVLLRGENGNHKGFPVGVTCRHILGEMKRDQAQVLIDAGALMLECNNGEVAQLWLEVDPKLEAVVYFNKDNDLVVKCRSEHGQEPETEAGADQKKNRRSSQKFQQWMKSADHLTTTDIPIELSPYRDRLDKCGVFLDDQHTRGTDLKFAVGSSACVTIGSRMKRDKLMQACMRMRQLGSGGHTVSFYLSHEATVKVGQDAKTDSKAGGGTGMITTEKVLARVAKNSQDYNNEGLVHWALAGKNYAQKLAAQEFHDTVDTHPLEKIYCLARQCVDDEVLSLKDLYGTHTEPQLLTQLIPEWFETTQRKLQTVEGCYSLSQRITLRYDSIRDNILQRLQETIPDKVYLSAGQLEEEQEKEIEQEAEVEAEEERQIVQPKAVAWMETPTLHENVRKAVLEGKKLEVKAAIQPLAEVFEGTSFWKLVQPECWAKAEVYASSDFISVVKPFSAEELDHFKTDAHLRPEEFLVSVQQSKPGNSSATATLSFKKGGGAGPTPPTLQILALSPFEVNELLPYFRSGQANSHLHIFSARLSPDQNLMCNTPSLQLPSPSILHLQSLNAPLIPEESKALASLLLISGNLYFASMEEQKSFAKFLGLVPRPWGPEQMNAFEKEMIRKSGFLLPKYRGQLQIDSCGIDIEQGAFQKDPSGLVRKILGCRHPVLSEVAHVSRLLINNWLVDLQ